MAQAVAPGPGGLARGGLGLRTQRLAHSQLGCPRPGPQRLVVTAAWGHFGWHKQDTPRLFVFGLGYSGLGAATYFMQRGWAVAGTCRTQEKCDKLAHCGVTTFNFDPSSYEILSGKALDCLRHATHVLSTVPPDADNDIDPVIMAHAQQLSEQAEHYRWVGYVSSTSVYGDYGGEWVDESSELRAAGGKGWSRIMAEHEWLALHDQFGLPVHIFRCGGIYGPRRSALDSVQRAGGPAAASAANERRARQRYTARCHVYDICQTLEASTRHPRPGASYNIADDDSADRGTVMQYAAELLARKAAGLPLEAPAAAPAGAAASSSSTRSTGGWDDAATFSGWDSASTDPADSGLPLSSINSSVSASSGSYDSADDVASQLVLPGGAGNSRSRWRGDAAAGGRRLEEKRVSNRRIKSELGVQLEFPTYRHALTAIASGDMRPFE